VSGTNNFAVSFAGLTASISNANSFAYTQWWFITQATSPLTTLTLGFRNDPYFFFLDDVDVSPVPIPGAVWLLGSGIVGLIGLKRRMRSRKSTDSLTIGRGNPPFLFPQS